MAETYVEGPFPGCCVSRKVKGVGGLTNSNTSLFVFSNGEEVNTGNNIVHKGNKVTFAFPDKTAKMRSAYPDLWAKHQELMKDRENMLDFREGDKVFLPEYDLRNGGFRKVLSIEDGCLRLTYQNCNKDYGSAVLYPHNAFRVE